MNEPTKVAAPVNGEVVPARQQAPSRKERFKAELDMVFGSLKVALPKHVDQQRYYRVILTAVNKPAKAGQDSVLDCTTESVLLCLMTAAQLGLEPDGPQQHCHLIPRRLGGRDQQPTCTLVIGYRGLIKLARNSGEIKSVAVRIVHEKDRFRWQYGLEEKLIHVPTDEENPGPVKAAYAVWHFVDGGHHFDVMTLKELERIRNEYGSDSKYSAWTTDVEEQYKKTVLRRSSKMVPNSIEMSRANAADDAASQGLAPSGFEMVGDGDNGRAPLALSEKPERLEVVEKKETLEEVAARQRAKRETTQAKQQPTGGGEVAGEMPDHMKTAVERQGTPAAASTTAPAVNAANAPNAPKPCTVQQRNTIATLAASKGVNPGEVAEKYNVESTRALTFADADAALAWLGGMPDAEPGAGG